ncbi:hypothetical protein [Hydrogenovibrio thermophilus]|uniref:Uncharacterized protein n=1 Tax=Hydrogenovibrio thermophilus TaxID=265883 RepID=A0A410H3Q7_9GAMM|nr:hypothetical protein [Hydrogenovibrio thermophilus]QAB15568.1 hypothetical protein EPV75_07760 [Hydrogenovibrio thermophilus]
MSQVIEKRLLNSYGTVYAKAVKNELVLSKRFLCGERGTDEVSKQAEQDLQAMRCLASRFRLQAALNGVELLGLQANPKRQSLLGLLR